MHAAQYTVAAARAGACRTLADDELGEWKWNFPLEF